MSAPSAWGMVFLLARVRYYCSITRPWVLWWQSLDPDASRFICPAFLRSFPRQPNPLLMPGLPGVYFYYEVSPVQALVEERRRGLLSFVTSTCGVVGGVYGLLGLVNTVIESISTRPRTRSL